MMMFFKKGHNQNKNLKKHVKKMSQKVEQIRGPSTKRP